MNITRGKINKAQRVVIYGPEGIGKSTFASKFPSPIFIDTEGSTNQMNVARLDKPSSWTMLLEQVKWIKTNQGEFETLVIDTMDWAERLAVEHVCAVHGKKGVEDFGYGNGYTYVAEEIGRFLNLLSDVIDAGINVVLTAHAQIRKFEQPEEFGGYDHWELKLGKKTTSQTAPLVKEWADMLLFANYKIISVAVDEKGKKRKGTGGARVMYTTHHPCWDAKNRHDLPAEMEFNFQSIAHIFKNMSERTKETVQDIPPAPIDQEKERVLAKEEKVAKTNRFFVDVESGSPIEILAGMPLPDPINYPRGLKEIPPHTYELLAAKDLEEANEEFKKVIEQHQESEYENVSNIAYDMKRQNPKMKWSQAFEQASDQVKRKKERQSKVAATVEKPIEQIQLVENKALNDLMKANNVSVDEIQQVVSMRGYYPIDTPISNYDPGFVEGVLVGAWDGMFKAIQENRAK